MYGRTRLKLAGALVAVFLIPLSAPRARAANAVPTQTALAAAQAQLKATQTKIDAVNRLLNSIPPELTNVAALARSFHSPQAAFVFVRDQIAYEPYRGVQKGAWGTLVTRGGNDLDKALLLAALLRAQNLDVSIVHGKVDAATAQQLTAQVAVRPDAVSLALAALTVPAAAVALGPNDKKYTERFDAAVQRRRKVFRATVESAYKELAASAPAAAAGAPTPASDHYWVQAKIGDKEKSFDPSLGANTPGTALATVADTFDPDSLPDKLYQTVRFTVVATYLDGGKLTQKNVLDATVRAADILGKPLRLVISPQTQDPAANDFKAQLLANANVTDGDVFQLHTESKPKNSGGGGGMFGGFGGLSGGGASPPPKQTGKGPVLVRLWLDVVESAPGRQPFKIRRIVLDRLNGVGDALAAGQSDALARLLLVQIWDGAADVGAFATPFILRTQNNELAAIRAAAAAAMGATSQDGKVSLDNQPPPVLSSAIVSLFFASDLARHFIGADIGAQMRSYYRMPRLAFMRRGFRVADWGAAVPSAVYAQDIDLLDPPLAITGPVNGVREFALRSGISDTALEAQAGMAHPRLGTLAVFAALPAGIAPKRYAQRSELPSDLPPPILAALRADVASGNTVVAPPALVAVNGVQAYGWWSFSDGTPYALGKMDLGGGQSMSEKGILVTKTVLKAIPYVKFLYSCYECGLAGATKSIGTFGSAGQAQFVGCMVKAICGFIVGVGFQLADMDTYDFREFQTMTQILGRLLGTATFRLGVSMGVGKACGLGLF